VGADDVCVDARLDVTETGANAPSVDSLGYGRYVVQWAGLGSSYARISDAHGSREGEELVVGEVSNTWISGVAGTPTGTFSLLYRTPSSTCMWPNCNLFSCGWSNCTSYEAIEAVTYGAGGLALTSGPVTVLSTNALGKGCQNFPVVDDARTSSRILPFSDLGVGTIVSWNPTFKDKDGDGPGACDLTFQDPAFGSLLFTPLTGDLAAGASLELLPAADLKDASSFDAAVIPDGTDRFLLAWVTGDGESVLVQSFLKGGQPDALDPWTVVNGVDGETVYSVRLMASADGVFAVLWDAEGGDADGRGILARRFYPDGSPLSPTMQVMASTSPAKQCSATDPWVSGSKVTSPGMFGGSSPCPGIGVPQSTLGSRAPGTRPSRGSSGRARRVLHLRWGSVAGTGPSPWLCAHPV
jgi:hypothetical protein